MGRFQAVILAAAMVAITAATAAASVDDFNNSADVNVLRDYHLNGSLQPVNQVTETQTTTGGLLQVGFGNDGSNKTDAWMLSNAQTATATFALPGPVTVASDAVQFSGGSNLPSSFVLQGLEGGIWTPLDTASSPSGLHTASFTAASVTSLRYTITGLSATSAAVLINEVQVFMPTGLTVPTVSPNNAYNILHDASNVTSIGSTTSNAWTAQIGNSTTTLYDGNYDTLSVRNTDPGTASFVIMKLNSSQSVNEAMTAMHLGWFNGQSWLTGFSVYTAPAAEFASLTAADSATQALTSSSATAIESVGWTQQFTTNLSNNTLGVDVKFADPGAYQYVMIVPNGAAISLGNVDEVELFATPEPASLGLLAVGGVVLLHRRRV